MFPQKKYLKDNLQVPRRNLKIISLKRFFHYGRFFCGTLHLYLNIDFDWLFENWELAELFFKFLFEFFCHAVASDLDMVLLTDCWPDKRSPPPGFGLRTSQHLLHARHLKSQIADYCFRPASVYSRPLPNLPVFCAGAGKLDANSHELGEFAGAPGGSVASDCFFAGLSFELCAEACHRGS